MSDEKEPAAPEDECKSSPGAPAPQGDCLLLSPDGYTLSIETNPLRYQFGNEEWVVATPEEIVAVLLSRM